LCTASAGVHVAALLPGRCGKAFLPLGLGCTLLRSLFRMFPSRCNLVNPMFVVPSHFSVKLSAWHFSHYDLPQLSIHQLLFGVPRSTSGLHLKAVGTILSVLLHRSSAPGRLAPPALVGHFQVPFWFPQVIPNASSTYRSTLKGESGISMAFKWRDRKSCYYVLNSFRVDQVKIIGG
jgi:hypothetical protein